MKRIISRVMMLILVAGIISGCGKQTNNENIDISDSVQEDNQILEDSIHGKEEVYTTEYAFAANSQMEGNAVIRPTCMLLLKTDGTVVGKGDSSYGELGNGSRTYCEDWTLVSNLENVKKIYANKYTGASNIDINREAASACYALTENGDLYRWGGNILEPEILLQNVEDFYCCGGGSRCFVVDYGEKGKGLMFPGGIFNLPLIIDITESVENSEILYASNGSIDFGLKEDLEHRPEFSYYMIIRDLNSEMTYFVDLEDLEDEFLEDEFSEAVDEYGVLHAIAVETKRYKISNNVQNVACVLEGSSESKIYVISKEGSINNFVIENIEDSAVTFLDEWDGSGYKSYYKLGENIGHCTFGLCVNEVGTIGDNDYGQLGDGTTLDYWDSWLSIDEFECTELYASDSDFGPFCVALDTNNNIWCWGGSFGSIPEIEVSPGMDINDDY